MAAISMIKCRMRAFIKILAERSHYFRFAMALADARCQSRIDALHRSPLCIAIIEAAALAARRAYGLASPSAGMTLLNIDGRQSMSELPLAARADEAPKALISRR